MNTKPLTRLLIWFTIVSLACNAPFLAQGGGAGGVTTIAERQSLISPADYASRVRELAAAIAALNQAQLQTLEHLRGTPSPETVDAALVQQSAAAMTVAQLAELLAATTASQAGASTEATTAAQPYVAAAQLGYLTVIQTQNLRDDYRSGRVSSEQAGNMVGVMGSMLWSGDQFDAGSTPSPFGDSLADPTNAPSPSVLSTEASGSASNQLDQTSGLNTEPAAWSSSSPATSSVTIIVPAPSAPVSGSLDPAQLSQMRTPEGQANADIVRVAAVSKLLSLGATSSPGGALGFAAPWPGYWQGGNLVLQIVVPAGLIFQTDFNRALPYFADGRSGLTATAEGAGPLVSQVNVTDGQPQVQAPIQVTTDQPPVTLDITAATPTGNATADSRDVSLTVQWTTTLADPTFTLVCFTGSGHSIYGQASGASGETTLTLAFSHLADTAVCQAKTADLATTLGESQVIGLEASGQALPPSLVPTPPPTAVPGPAANTYDGTFTLTQVDDGCNFSAAPSTGGTIQIVVDSAGGTASGTLSGGGSGARTGLECTGNFGDLNWSQNYTATFLGTVDAAGNVNMTGTISGTGNGEWVNCHDASNTPNECPTYSSGGYSYPISLTGTIDQGAGSGSGAMTVSDINLATTGTWTVSGSSTAGQAQAGCSWSGTWDVGWNGAASGAATMTLVQSGDAVTGEYTHDTGKIAGTVSGLVLQGTWSEAPSYSGPTDAGPIEFTLAPDCNSFTGKWSYEGSGTEGDWSGTRIG